MKKRVLNIIEIILILMIGLICIISLFHKQLVNKFELLKIIDNKLLFTICILIPFFIIIMLELIKFINENKRKQLENTMKMQLEELRILDDNSELSKEIEQKIETQIKKIENAKKDFEKIEQLEQTIQIPLDEIKEQIKQLNKKLTKVSKEKEEVQDDTMVLFTKDDIKEVIKKELDSKKTVIKNKKDSE